MLFKALSAAVYGIDANIIEVEVDVSGIKINEDRKQARGWSAYALIVRRTIPFPTPD